MAQGCLTLLSDFGLSDGYVGMMKGAIAQINPTLTVIDLTHQIPPQNIAAGRFCLMSAYPYFPSATVHVALVDPGVGSHRRAIAVELATGFLVGPDNGLLSGVLSQNPAIAAVELTNPQYWRVANPCTTFHGRDIFAPVGAHLASGVPLAALGTAISLQQLVSLTLPDWTDRLDKKTGQRVIQGAIQAIDHFGNLITNIPQETIQASTWSSVIQGIQIPGHKTYAEVPKGSLLALVGSHGWVEIAKNQGNAQQHLQVEYAEKVEVFLESRLNDS
jgi:S-adenosylmethionine hydrolase